MSTPITIEFGWVIPCPGAYSHCSSCSPSLSGGAETLFGNNKRHEVALEADKKCAYNLWNRIDDSIVDSVPYQNYFRDHRPALTMDEGEHSDGQGGSVPTEWYNVSGRSSATLSSTHNKPHFSRPGILILVNDADWELLVSSHPITTCTTSPLNIHFTSSRENYNTNCSQTITSCSYPLYTGDDLEMLGRDPLLYD